MAGGGLETRKYLEKLTVAVHCVTQAATVRSVPNTTAVSRGTS